MVFVKVRETYDLHTVQNKMTVIGIHTPKPFIIKSNFPGLLMQCKMYRPVSCDVRIACASTLPLDPLGVGTGEGDVAPEDLFNPILYKATSNIGMSQIEARIFGIACGQAISTVDVDGETAVAEVDGTTSLTNEFNVYYGLLSNAHEWRHANPQQGLEMRNLRPFVYEVLYNVGDQPDHGISTVGGSEGNFAYPTPSGGRDVGHGQSIRGNAKPIPWINCTSYDGVEAPPGFSQAGVPGNNEQDIPWINCVVGAVIIPPSRRHELFYRMVVEWTIEFSGIRPVSEITSFAGLNAVGASTHYQNYSYPATKQAVTGSSETVMDKDSSMISSNVDITKVM